MTTLFGQDSDPALRQVILDFIKGEVSVTDATESLINAGLVQRQSESSNDRNWLSVLGLFQVVLDLPAEADDAREQLVQFFEALKERPEAHQNFEQGNGTSMSLWHNFTMMAREMWDSEDRLTVQQWRNLHSFYALLWAKDVLPSYSLYPIWGLRSELEDRPARTTDIKVDLSEVYIHYAGPQMFRSREVWDYNRPGDPRSGNRARVGALLKDQGEFPNGYSAERWNFWKQRLADINEAAQVPEAIRDAAKRTLAEMQQVEA